MNTERAWRMINNTEESPSVISTGFTRERVSSSHMNDQVNHPGEKEKDRLAYNFSTVTPNVS